MVSHTAGSEDFHIFISVSTSLFSPLCSHTSSVVGIGVLPVRQERSELIVCVERGEGQVGQIVYGGIYAI